MTHDYELMLVLHPELDSKDEKERDRLVKKFLGHNRYTLTDVTTVGKKNLAYPIMHYNEGLYILIHLNSEGLVLADLEKQKKLTREVLRYLVVRLNSRKN